MFRPRPTCHFRHDDAFRCGSGELLGRLTQGSGADSLSLLYNAADRSQLIANLSPQSPATVIPHYNPQGQRDQKLGNGTLTRFAYDPQGHLLEETNQAANAALQQADPFVTDGLNTFNQQLRNLPGIVNPLIESLPTPYGSAIIPLTNDAINTAAPFSQTTQAELRAKLYPSRSELIWLDDTPLAVIQSRKPGSPQEVFFIHPAARKKSSLSTATTSTPPSASPTKPDCWCGKAARCPLENPTKTRNPL